MIHLRKKLKDFDEILYLLMSIKCGREDIIFAAYPPDVRPTLHTAQAEIRPFSQPKEASSAADSYIAQLILVTVPVQINSSMFHRDVLLSLIFPRFYDKKYEGVSKSFRTESITK
jgi:hypothetical protein